LLIIGQSWSVLREEISKGFLGLSPREQLSAQTLIACAGGLIGVAQQFLQQLWLASRLQITQAKALAQ